MCIPALEGSEETQQNRHRTKHQCHDEHQKIDPSYTLQPARKQKKEYPALDMLLNNQFFKKI